jgi:hypothetical protein
MSVRTVRSNFPGRPPRVRQKRGADALVRARPLVALWRLAICAVKSARQILLDFSSPMFYSTSGGF